LLALGLDELQRVVDGSQQTMKRFGAGHFAPQSLRWDKKYLDEIVGDYEQTLEECRKLIQKNKVYQEADSAYRNLTWHKLVRPNVEKHRQRLQLHEARIQNVLRPLEM
jgi:hypothetical protein